MCCIEREREEETNTCSEFVCGVVKRGAARGGERVAPLQLTKRNKEEIAMAAAAVEEELSFDTDKLSYEIFSMLESKFLFGYDDTKLWVPAAPPLTASSAVLPVAAAADSVKSQRGKVCVLCIDGGGGCGMLGILPGKVLAYLEHALKSKSGEPNARISDYFDVAAGTGVGGVLAAMLFATRDGALPLFCADDTWRFFADRGERLFRKASPSPSSSGFLRCLFPGGGGSTTAATERAMKEVFGEDLTLRDTVNYDLRSSAPVRVLAGRRLGEREIRLPTVGGVPGHIGRAWAVRAGGDQLGRRSHLLRRRRRRAGDEQPGGGGHHPRPPQQAGVPLRPRGDGGDGASEARPMGAHARDPSHRADRRRRRGRPRGPRRRARLRPVPELQLRASPGTCLWVAVPSIARLLLFKVSCNGRLVVGARECAVWTRAQGT
ncbi:hypothetical protein GW17_00011489 [Ensete ventricosum]|nr:hypothetical protein GW17_00011489 [Ensete ventricosum]